MQPEVASTPTRAPISVSRPPTIVYGVLLDDELMDWPGRNQLMRSIADHTTVVLLQAAPSRSRWPRRPHLDRLDDNLVVVRCAMDARHGRIGRKIPRISSLLDGGWLRSELERNALRDPLLWLTVPDPRLAMSFPDRSLIYDCMDPNFLAGGNADHDRRELPLARRARLVFASAGALLDRMAQVNPRSYLLPNAAPLRPPSGGPRPAALTGRTGPVVGYLGTIDWRFDAEHVLQAARHLPEVTFAVVGRVNPDQEPRIAELRRESNVLFPGQVGLAEGDAWVSAFDLALIPFVPGQMNDCINPVKMFMYLSAGLPVVATDVAECRSNPLVETTSDASSFGPAIRRQLTEDNARKQAERRSYAAQNTWDTRAIQAIEILREQGMWSSVS